MRFELLCQNITFEPFFRDLPLYSTANLQTIHYQVLSMHSEMRECGQSTSKRYSKKSSNMGRNRNKGSNNRHKRSGKGWNALLDLEIIVITICLNSSLLSLMLSVKLRLRLFKARFTTSFLLHHVKDIPTLSNLRRSI
jgi:hypothetical protein